jgi:CRISPR/Cas system CSM-associated protein Csm3 (group 7 of RAMP superfamily)
MRNRRTYCEIEFFALQVVDVSEGDSSNDDDPEDDKRENADNEDEGEEENSEKEEEQKKVIKTANPFALLGSDSD